MRGNYEDQIYSAPPLDDGIQKFNHQKYLTDINVSYCFQLWLVSTKAPETFEMIDNI